VGVIEAAHVFGKPASVDYLAQFADLTPTQAEQAARLAVDLGLLQEMNGTFESASPLTRFFATGDMPKKAIILRLVLESYEPFVFFRDRLISTDTAATAAQQTRAVLDLDAHREEVKDTLISLGTFSQALAGEGGARYLPVPAPAANRMEELAAAAEDVAAAEGRVRAQVGPGTAQVCSPQDVIRPLADALMRAANGDGRGAVVAAGNAVESYLTEFGARAGIDLTGAHGINAKVQRLAEAGVIAPKIAAIGRYLGNIRNGADHGVDPDVGAAWAIRPSTGIEFVYVACSFIAVCRNHELGDPPEL
jgi:hypothetical protein